MGAPMPDPQARIRLAALLFRTAMPQLAKALAAAGHAPPRAEEKGRLFGRLEEAAWSFGPEVDEGSEEDGWEEAVLARHPVRARLAAAVEDVVKAR
jgi:hypothetical protein